MTDWLITSEQCKRVDGKSICETWLVIEDGGRDTWLDIKDGGSSPESGLAGLFARTGQGQGAKTRDVLFVAIFRIIYLFLTGPWVWYHTGTKHIPRKETL